MTNQTSPPPGTRENAIALQQWRLTTWIVCVFILLVGVGMLVAHARFKSSDPWLSPQLLELKQQLHSQPKNEELKAQIRDLDLQLRERYFHLQSVKTTGVYLLFGGLVVLVYANLRTRQLSKLPPMPQPDTEAEARLTRNYQLSRRALAAFSVVALAGLSVLAFSNPRSPLADQDAVAALLSPDTQSPQPSYTITEQELQNNWPRFRGHLGSGVATAGPSLESTPEVIWQTAVPAPGFSSPIVWGNQVILTGGNAEQRDVFSFDATSRTLRWQQQVQVPTSASTKEVPEIPDMTGHAASTGATDGERIYVIFATGELAAFTLDGQPIWSKNLGPIDNTYGHAASLACWQDKVIVQLDQGEEDTRESKIIAVDGATGEVFWQKARPVGASWATPIVIDAAGRPQVITLGLPWVIAYSPADGTELWRARPLEGEITPSPIQVDDLIVMVDPGMYQLVALRPDGSGDVSETHQAWRVDADTPDITSPVSANGLIFTLTSDGRLTCFEAKSGTEIWKQAIDAGGELQASPSISGQVLLLLSAAGDVIGIDAGRDFKELWRIKLDDEFYASPAFANGKLYVRGNKNLWCLGSNQAMTQSDAP